MPTPVTDPDVLAKLNAGDEGKKPVTDPEILKKLEGGDSAIGTATDIAKSFGRGVVKGVEGLMGLPGTANELIGAGVSAAGSAMGFPEKKIPKDSLLPTPGQIERGLETVTGPLGEPKTTAGKYAQSVGEFAPAVTAGPGGWVSKLVAAFGGGAGSEAAGQLTEGSGAEPYARIVGGFAGAMAPNILARAITPLPATAAHRANVASLEKEGVTGLTAGERSGYKPLRYAEEHLGGSPMAGGAAEEAFTLPREQFTRAALTRVGETADRATPEVVDRAFSRIGNQFDTLAARNSAKVDQQYITDLLKEQAEYDHLFVDPLKKPIVQNVVDHAFNKLSKSGTMDGSEYKALRSRIERMRRSNAADPEVSGFLAGVRDAMDNLMERSIKANNPADAGAWAEVRNQYRNMLVIERATTGAETGGILTPSKLKQGAVSQSRRQYARGKGDFAELARAGENVMPGLPQSGTAPRHLTEAGPLKLATTGITGRALMSGPVQAYLGNQSMTDILKQLPPAKAAAIQSIIANSPELTKP